MRITRPDRPVDVRPVPQMSFSDDYGEDGATKLVARNRRLFVVQDMIKNFRLLAARQRGEVTADVSSASADRCPDGRAQGDAARLIGGKDVQINSRVDPNLLGGLIVKMGSRMIDSSLRTKLNNLKTAMKESADGNPRR